MVLALPDTEEVEVREMGRGGKQSSGYPSPCGRLGAPAGDVGHRPSGEAFSGGGPGAGGCTVHGVLCGRAQGLRSHFPPYLPSFIKQALVNMF